MLISDRIRAIAERKNMNLKQFSSVAGVNYRTLQHYLSGERTVGAEFLAALGDQLGVSTTWVLTGKGPAFLDELGTNGHISAGEFIPIPRYMVEASAGQDALVHEKEGSGYYAFNRKFLERRGLKPNNLSVISVKGDSMEPDLSDGDLILLDRAQVDPRDSNIYVVRFDNDLFVKRVQRLPRHRIQLLSTNPNYPPITVDAADLDGIQIIGRVVNSTREW